MNKPSEIHMIGRCGLKLYNELRDEQLPDGSWSGFEDMIAEQAKRKHFKTTARAM